MELQVNDLITSIKKDGIAAAEAEAAAIIADAKERAAAITAAAADEAARTKAKATGDIALLKESASVGIEHAKRDAVLAFKEEIRAEFEKLLAAKVAKVTDGAALATLIRAALTGEDPAAYTAEVAAVTEELKAALADEIRGGLELRVSEKSRVGFRLAAKDGSGYFDCSDEQIAEMLKPFFPELKI